MPQEKLPQFIAVKSSNILSVGYLQLSRSLFIKFSRGDLYRYEDVPIEVHHAFMVSASKGAFFVRNIKDHYEAELL